VERFVDYDEWFAGEVEKGLGAIERGATLSREEVGVRIEALLEKRSRG
jgi:predicted transcriptional regulator